MSLSELEESRKKNLEKISRLTEPYPYKFEPCLSLKLVKMGSQRLKGGQEGTESITGAGRIISKRGFGKLVFLDIQDESGKMQAVASKEKLGEPDFQIINLVDTGDIIGVKGVPYKTKRGEDSILLTKAKFLSKALNPLPEKWHGLKDIETRYRKRHLDLIANHEVKEVFRIRARIIKKIRKFLEEEGYLEVETPILQPSYGGANARPFITTAHAWNSKFYLSISPELYLKRLIIGGFNKVYTICKNFRNEDVDKTHNPEFTMMECYAAYQDYEDMMALTEKMFESIAREINSSTKISYQGKEIDLKSPWQRISVYEGLKKYASLDPEKATDEELKEALSQNELELETYNRGLAITELFEHLCEENLIQPTFVIDHPKETTPLCKLHRNKKDLIERFEPYINGWEMGNAYSELNDPELQEKFFKEQAGQGRAKGENHPIDKEFIDALRQGMPPTGGLGIGIDRLVMLFTNQPAIKDVILFPQMKPEKTTAKL